MRGREGGRGARQREVDEAVEVAGAGPAVVGTRQEVGREGQQEGLGGAKGQREPVCAAPAPAPPRPPARSRC